LGGTITQKTYTAHSDNIFAIAWSPDGRFIASGGRDRTVQIWQPEHLSSPILLGVHPQYILSLAWSPITPIQSQTPSPSRLASGCTSGLVHLWHINPSASPAQTLQPFLTYSGHIRFVRSLSWSPDGQYIASGGEYGDNTVQIWHAENGHLLFTHTTQYRIFAAPWSPITSLIASGSFDGSVQIWSALNGGHVQAYTGHQGPVYTVSWSPDGTRIVSAGQDTRAVVWSIANGKELLVYTGHTAPIKALAWSPDGHSIASGGDDETLHVWSAQDARVYAVYPHASWIRALSWSPDAMSLASASGKTVQIWPMVRLS
jgi:WD40 repeat protein